MSKRERNLRYREKLRLRFFTEYGTICVCCGEDEIKFLTVHHKDGDGASHRRRLKPTSMTGGGGTNFYAKILKLAERDDNLETLCFNCNTAVQFWGSCPHQDTKGISESGL